VLGLQRAMPAGDREHRKSETTGECDRCRNLKAAAYAGERHESDCDENIEKPGRRWGEVEQVRGGRRSSWQEEQGYVEPARKRMRK
jgi:hypothetical protein